MRRLAALSFLALLVPALGIAQATEWRESAQTIVHLLDYVGVDYPEFVRDGKVLDQAEYQEQLEFAAQAVMLLKVLPENPKRAQLIGDAQALAGLLAAKANGNQVTAAADKPSVGCCPSL